MVLAGLPICDLILVFNTVHLLLDIRVVNICDLDVLPVVNSKIYALPQLYTFPRYKVFKYVQT